MKLVNVNDTDAATIVKDSVNKERPGMVVNTRKVDKEEVKRVMKLVRASFKKTPPKLSAEKGEYDLMNSVIASCNFETCENDLDSIRTFYETLFPSMLQMYGEIESLGRQIAIQRRDTVPIIEALNKKGAWEVGDVGKNFQKAADYINNSEE